MAEQRVTITEVIRAIAEGKAVEIFTKSEGIFAAQEDLYELADTLAGVRDQVHLVALFSRPGVRYFMAVLEHTYFSPLSPAGQLFRYRYVRWQSRVFVLISVPIECRSFFDVVAEQTGMRVAAGIPTMIGATVNFFPIYDNCWTLENANSGDLPHYRVSREAGIAFSNKEIDENEYERRIAAAHEDMLQWEDEALRKFYQDRNIKTVE